VIKPVRAAVQTSYPIADAYVDSDHPSANYGGGTYLDTYFWDYTYINDTIRNTYLMFDLSLFTSELHNISSAILRLHAWYISGPTPHVAVHSCSDVSWREFEITWQNAPSFSSIASDITTIAIEDLWYSWNVTDLVRNNLGKNMTLVLTITDVGESYSVSYRSRQASSNAPELVIDYSIIPEFPSFLILPLFMIATLLAVIVYKRKHSV
jgi:hypothetical protein